MASSVHQMPIADNLHVALTLNLGLSWYLVTFNFYPHIKMMQLPTKPSLHSFTAQISQISGHRPVRSHVNLFESDFTRGIFVQQIEELHGRNFTIEVWAEPATDSVLARKHRKVQASWKGRGGNDMASERLQLVILHFFLGEFYSNVPEAAANYVAADYILHGAYADSIKFFYVPWLKWFSLVSKHNRIDAATWL